MTENKNVFGILGHPLGHTLSPQIHTRLFEISGEQAEYKILDTPPEKLTDSFEYFKSLTGFNITIPYKIDIIKMCDTLDDTAKRYNSVNCIANVNGVSTGYNTDCTGFTKAVGAMGMTLTNKVLLLGCGGVGRMMAIEAVREGGELTIAVRDADIPVAKALCEEIKQNYNSAKVGFCLLSEVKGDFDLMVNATPVGMYPNTDASPLTEETLGRITLNGFFDAIYNPRETKLMKMVSDKGCKEGQRRYADACMAGGCGSYYMERRRIHSRTGAGYLGRNDEARVMRPVYLCGFMGCGKSHIGRMLARECTAVFIDLDRYIVDNQKMTIPEIFAQKGEPYFRDLEAQYIRNFRGRTIVATGGGAILRDETAEFARKQGVVIFLNAGFDTCYERIKNDSNRPLVVNNTKEQLKAIYDSRLPVYRKNSTFEVNANASDRIIAGEIIKLVELDAKRHRKTKG